MAQTYVARCKRPLAGAALALVPSLALAQDCAPPAEPLVVELEQPGKKGGELHTLIGREKDVRLLVVYGYARLVGYTPELELVPDILEAVEVEDGRSFTLRLREGHKWSDGQPFTAEDFRYYWEDVANNEQLRPAGFSPVLLVDDEGPTFEVLDEQTVRYSWSQPNPAFLPALAGATPLFIYRPAHYLKQFHVNHADEQELARLVAEDNARDWAQLHGRRDEMYDFTNPELPTLQPWRVVTEPPATRFVAEANPCFHRVDANGVQLPYIERVVLEVVDSKLIPVKAGAGETDLQGRGLQFKDYTFLKESEERNDMVTTLWETARGAQLALYPNLNASDPVWRDLFRDPDVRRALSLGIDREEINQVVYYGLGIGGGNTVLPQSPLYSDDVRFAWSEYDPDKANALLDEAGLAERNSEGIRLLPDGRPMEIVVETAGEETEETDVMQLVADSWRDLGIKVFTKPSQREVLRNRVFSGEAVMTISYGLEHGLPTADMPPTEFAPVEQIKYQWPKWGQHYETKGSAGEAVDLPEAERLFELYQRWMTSQDPAEREAIWDDMLQIWGDQVFTIGLVGGVRQPIVRHEDLRGVPEEGVWNWEPGAQFGIYRPDTFWWDR